MIKYKNEHTIDPTPKSIELHYGLAVQGQCDCENKIVDMTAKAARDRALAAMPVFSGDDDLAYYEILRLKYMIAVMHKKLTEQTNEILNYKLKEKANIRLIHDGEQFKKDLENIPEANYSMEFINNEEVIK